MASHSIKMTRTGPRYVLRVRNYIWSARTATSTISRRYYTPDTKLSVAFLPKRSCAQSHLHVSNRPSFRATSTFSAPVDEAKVEVPGCGLYPSFWLRDNCQCSKCIHPDTRQRVVDTFAIPENVTAEEVRVENSNVTIKWSDGHSGLYPYSWLSDHTFGARISEQRPILAFRPFESVRSDYKSLPTVTYQEVMETEEGVLEWLEQIVRYGFSMITGVPVNPESTQELLEKISFIRQTHYGGFWDFTSDLTFKDTAYTSEALGAHTDNTYFTDPARLQLFHLLSHTHGSGGATLLVDGFNAAQKMLRESAAKVERLIDLPQPSHSSGNEDVCIQPGRSVSVLERDSWSRQLYQVRWNNYDRSAKVNWTADEQKEWYAAARHWNEIIKRPDMELWLQLEPGTALIFDNWRMMHGRSEFTGKRRMCGGYINGDDFVSRYRLLKLGREKALDCLGTYPDVINA